MSPASAVTISQTTDNHKTVIYCTESGIGISREAKGEDGTDGRPAPWLTKDWIILNDRGDIERLYKALGDYLCAPEPDAWRARHTFAYSPDDARYQDYLSIELVDNAKRRGPDYSPCWEIICREPSATLSYVNATSIMLSFGDLSWAVSTLAKIKSSFEACMEGDRNGERSSLD